jgi:hypothetical protein
MMRWSENGEREVDAVAPTQSIKAPLIEVCERKALDRAFKRARKEGQAVLVLGGPLHV